MRPIVNMLVDLDGLRVDRRAHDALLASLALTISLVHGATDADARWIAATFGGVWPQESQAGWNWFIRDGLGNSRGFATYEQRSLHHWWLDAWLDDSSVGMFGPMGVDPALRGKGLGCVLTQRALLSLKDLGFSQALIPAVGPVDFYERCCGARVVQRLER
ncbi:MAG: N-acetyltransferase [Candidatus Eremiobacteraeota bacterium]|nr:N-acetyltransferase [Candidatus Eremiobacteraeota bacterium]